MKPWRRRGGCGRASCCSSSPPLDVSGFEIARAADEVPATIFPIVFISGDRTQPLDRAAGLLVAGGDDYIVKPADQDELLARTRRLISRSQGRAASPRAPIDAELTAREREVLELLAGG